MSKTNLCDPANKFPVCKIKSDPERTIVLQCCHTFYNAWRTSLWTQGMWPSCKEKKTEFLVLYQEADHISLSAIYFLSESLSIKTGEHLKEDKDLGVGSVC